MKTGLVSVREMGPEDASAWLDVHRRAVRGIAAADYPPSVIDAWAPMPVTGHAINQVLENPDQEYRLVVELDGRVAGIAAAVFALSELRACYVAPEATRRGIGSCLIRKLEDAARHHGLTFLQVDSSITAEPIYLRAGYEVTERGDHTLHTGQRMACVKMRKTLVGA